MGIIPTYKDQRQVCVFAISGWSGSTPRPDSGLQVLPLFTTTTAPGVATTLMDYVISPWWEVFND